MWPAMAMMLHHVSANTLQRCLWISPGTPQEEWAIFVENRSLTENTHNVAIVIYKSRKEPKSRKFIIFSSKWEIFPLMSPVIRKMPFGKVEEAEVYSTRTSGHRHTLLLWNNIPFFGHSFARSALWTGPHSLHNMLWSKGLERPCGLWSIPLSHSAKEREQLALTFVFWTQIHS